MTTNKEIGMKLIEKAGEIMHRDLNSAWIACDYNMTVRRAQEVAELALKGVLEILGVDYPKIHDVGHLFVEHVIKKAFPVEEDILEKIERISFWLAEARAPSFYLERDYTEEDARKAFEDANFVYDKIKAALDIIEGKRKKK
jgi:HEPN domain-containing protein